MSRSSPSATQKLQLKMKGRKVSQEQIFDMKTCVQQNMFNIEEIRFLLNQTSKFLLAYHRYRLLDHPEVKDVRQLVSSNISML
jgi:hypothetical protein